MVCAGVLAIAAMGSATRVSAQTPAQQKEFVPAPADASRESVAAMPLVAGAYGFVWVALSAYLFILWRRQNQVERDLADVTARLAKGR